jgi:acetyl esterase/lipase
VRGQAPTFGGSDIYDFFTSNGYAIADVNYRLANEYTYPAQLYDIESVLAFMDKKASAWHIDPNRICICGQSSGAHLALLYGYAWNSKGKIKVVIDGYGPTDLPDSSVLKDHLVFDLTTFMGVSCQANPQLWKQASPIFYMASALPTIIYQGTADTTVYPVQSDMLVDSLEANGIPHQYYRWQNCNHGWWESYWEQSQPDVLMFLSAYL